MRVCVVGGGLAGALLAWRLARYDPDSVDLVLGEHRATDATEASGGAVRGYEPDPAQSELALESLLELLGSKVLQGWSGYRQVGFTYLRSDGSTLDGEVAELARCLPGAVEVVPGPAMAERGFVGLPAAGAAVIERYAGYLSPDRLRRALLGELATRGAGLVQDTVTAVAIGPDGSAGVTVDGRQRGYDAVVLATGAWTANLLRASGLPAGGYRTKSIQYGLYPVGAWVPAPFTDERTGVYAKPTDEGQLLLGCPTGEWDLPPGRSPVTSAVHERAVELATALLPALRLGPASTRVSATDCYTDPPLLALRSVLDEEHRLYTFTGGSGGSAKTALAASARAADRLTGARTAT